MARPVIYEPKGRALEYAPYACEVYDACDHRCTYCFNVTSGKRSAEDFYRPARPIRDLITNLRKVVSNFRAVEGQPLKRVLLSFGCDPYQPVEEEHHLTRQVIELFIAEGVPFTVLSKGGTRVLPDLELIASGLGSYAATIILTEEKDREIWEPNAATIADRVEALRAAHELGIRTWVSIEPPVIPGQALDVIDMVAPVIDAYKVGKWNHEDEADEIDWRDFAYRAYGRLKAVGKPYLIKRDLHPYYNRNAILNTIPEGF